MRNCVLDTWVVDKTEATAEVWKMEEMRMATCTMKRRYYIYTLGVKWFAHTQNTQKPVTNKDERKDRENSGKKKER